MAGTPAEACTLDLEVSPADLPRLLRAPALASRRDGRARTSQASIVWHDTVDGELAGDSLSLSQGGGAEGGGRWRLERLRPNGHGDWLPACAAPLLAEAASPAALGRPMPGKLAPVAAFRGRLRRYPLSQGGVSAISVLEGTLRGVAQDRPACRVMLRGEPAAVAQLAGELAELVRLHVPRAGLAAQAIAVARGRETEPRHTGAPAIPPGLTIDGALVLVTAHLADVVLHWAPLAASGQTPEPVHQMRVGVRRLRSALAAFRHAVRGEDGTTPWLDELDEALKGVAAVLGAARDWDVFLAETGAEIGREFAGDGRVERLLAAAGRKRAACYAALGAWLGSRDWARLELQLALLPWRRPWLEHGRALDLPVEAYAARALDRRLKHVMAPGATLAGLAPPALHETRKQAKRLRYATEIFAPLFPEKAVRKYLPRLEKLQAVLGAVNDTAVAAALMAQLGGGPGRAFAAGVVQGYCAGRSARAMHKAERAWSRLYRPTPFWD